MIDVAIGNNEQMKQYILKLIDAKDKDFAVKTVEAFGVSKSTVYNYVKKMCEDGVLEKREGTVPAYALVNVTHEFEYDTGGTLGEDKVFRADIRPLLEDLEKNVFSAWQYAFTEMMNNAIEHSRATRIAVLVSKNALKTSILRAIN